ncbi:MAG: hypothetical protein GF411_01260 [Candidatus Lokiarchaeota archaeon]|nr:hypothetical protein [Candidatus Lokiarchaeota archaeon]
MSDVTTKTLPNKEQFTFIRKLRRESKGVRVRFKVLELSTPREVFSRKSNRIYQIANAVLADETAKITLQLWNDDIDKIKPGRTYVLENGYVSVYNECMFLNRGYGGDITPSTETIETPSELKDMSLPFVGIKVSRRAAESSTPKTFRGDSGRTSKGYCSFKEF